MKRAPKLVLLFVATATILYQERRADREWRAVQHAATQGEFVLCFFLLSSPVPVHYSLAAAPMQCQKDAH